MRLFLAGFIGFVAVFQAPSALAGPTLEITKVPQSAFVLPSSTLQYTIYYRNLDTSPPLPDPMVDIVWIVDSSGSMSQEQSDIASNAQIFFDSLQGADFRLAVVDMNVTNSSPRSAPVRTNGNLGLPSTGTGDWTTDKNQFSTMVQVGTSGSIDEFGIVVSQETLAHYTFRPGAQIIFILVTDEPDRDPGLNPGTLGVAITDMNNNGVIVYAIASFAEPIPMYCGVGSITQATGGLCGDINTSDWSSTLGAIGQDIIVQLGTSSVTDTLPAGLTYVSSSNNGQLNGGRVDWSLGPLPSGSSGTLTLVIQVTAAPGSTIINSSQFFTDGAIPIQASASVFVVTPSYSPTHTTTFTFTPTFTWTATFTDSPTSTPSPTPHPELQVTKLSSSDFVSVGQTFTYSIIYKNTGNRDAINTYVWDTLPAGIGFEGADGTATLSGNMVVWDLTGLTIKPGESGSLWIEVISLPESLGQPVTNMASASFVNAAMPLDPALKSDTGPVVTVVTAPDQFALDRNAFNPTAGQMLTIRLSASRAGRARLTVYNSAGELIAKISDKTLAFPGAWIDEWDGKNNLGDVVSSGIYLVHFAGPVQSRTRRIAVIR